MRHTQRKGDIGKAMGISTFTKLGYDVATLLTESAAYDLIVDDGHELYRVQTKYTTGKEVDLRHIHSNTKGYITKKIDKIVYDWLYIYRADGVEFLIKNCPINQSTITPQEKDILSKVIGENPNG